MAKAATQTTSPPYYNEEARAKLRRHVEQALARRRACPRSDGWDQLWNMLEEAARLYSSSVKSLSMSSGVHDAREGLARCRKLIDDALCELKKPALSNWNFVSDNPFCRLVETRPLQDVADMLTAADAVIAAKIKELEELGAGQGLRVYKGDDCVRELKGRLFELGHEWFGREVGGPTGPLITFVRLALLPILKDATPDSDTLRQFAKEHKTDWLEGGE